MEPKILIIDDDDLVSLSLKKVLVKQGYAVDVCNDAGQWADVVKNFQPDLILLDIYLTTHNGIDILKLIKKDYTALPVIMITGYADIKMAVTSIKLGAFDFLLKPIDLEQLNIVLDKALENIKLRSEIDRLHTILETDKLTKEFFGRSPKIQRLLDSVEKLASSSDTTILLEGESGTGKEVFARFIHQNSPRASAPFITINCGSIPRELAESELFGHEKGAFTGASQKTKMGKFELANNGTLLLDEIGELSLEMQVKLLRVLQERKFYRLGGEKEISVNVRVLAATNRNLEEEVKKGNFREDLFYRLNVVKIDIPPLRERQEDIPFIAYSFLQEFNQKFNKSINGIDPAALDLLKSYRWKGNIRELRNVMERVVLLCEEDMLRVHHFAFLIENKSEEDNDSDAFVLKIPSKGITMDEVVKTLIQKTLLITNGNQVQAAKILGLSRSKLRYRMEQLGIEVTKQIN
ncbi:two component, sigma54 specific, Fis family transcriptional regulator [Melioribacter roseus P3M-2]|uniref:Two component, sigma54 specific, Fis family transcriptional regulator n=1 Tax=Melioribacter roseus (strain DSM 23840 / JCM 17771 / VKM B-2668 / P3M-2) TaxID=1191523 RepID=I6YX65_MELRP|nr:sigma-54 dependent transcriptional regulator [Melioribacter roseus]AFN75182.1 two component, sigma54 specific, Fis family transcriptional regulator [Melioribacter roseus P3M-2]